MRAALATLLLMSSMAILFGIDRAVHATLEEELRTLADGAGDVWAYSGNGGYVFKFERDVSGGAEKELFVNFSIRPNVWHVYAGSDERMRIGMAEFASFDFIHTQKNDGRTRILRAYSADSYAEHPFEPFGKFVIEQIIADTGIESKVRRVGVDATESEFNNLKLGALPAGIAWAKPTVEAITLRDFLLEKNTEWFEFDPDKAQVRNGYYRLPGDEIKISEIGNGFTPNVALKLLKRQRGISPTVDEWPPQSRAETVDFAPTTEPGQKGAAASPTTAGRSDRPRFLVVLLAIIAVVIGGAIAFRRRRSQESHLLK